MSSITCSNSSAADRYDTALRLRRKRHCLAHVTAPLPTNAWPPENIALLARYQAWLVDTGVAQNCILQIYIPVAGHVLGLALIAHEKLDLRHDLERALTFLKASEYSVSWLKMCRGGLGYFRRFLRFERGLVDICLPALVDISRYHAGLPPWLITHITNLQTVRQVNWRPACRANRLRGFWSAHTQLWRWLFANSEIVDVSDVRRQLVYDYIDQRLAAGYAVSTVNMELRCFQATLRFMQGEGVAVPLALLHMDGLKQPDALPRFLTDGQVKLLKEAFEQAVLVAKTGVQRRDTLLNRAAFYLLWQAGLRVGEVEELQLADLDLAHSRLIVRQGKGLHDRRVYLPATALAALHAYLPMRGQAQSEHLFIYRFKPLRKDLVRARLKALGARVGVKVTPHRLRHTFATQLVNAGCSITSIQQLLGHQRMSSTLIYARVHDKTVADDYFRAMRVIEDKVGISAETETPTNSVAGDGEVDSAEAPTNQPVNNPETV